MIRFVTALIALFAMAHAQTGDAVRTGHAESRIIAEKTAAVPGETLWVALAQELEDGWHVYWKNPGDSGLPLMLNWILPTGFEAGEIGYPLPHKLPLGPLTNFGHEGSPTFLVPMTVPADAPIGGTAQFDVFAEWLICLDVCIPESAQLSMSLPIAASADDVPGQASRIREARSALPKDLGLKAAFTDDGETVVLRIDGAPAGDPFFFPNAQGMTEPTPPQPELRQDGSLYLRLTPGIDYQVATPDDLPGLLVVDMDGQEVGVEIAAKRNASLAVPTGLGAEKAAASSGAGESSNIFLIFAFALLGGVVLNAMPCVFPIVFLKAAGVAQLAGAERKTIRADAYAYTAGVLATFAAIAGLLLILRGAGAQLGWGFQLQSPIAVGFFAVVVFLIGLNLTGMFELGTSVQGVGGELAQKKGPAGSFFTGLLAVLVAAPCIGPFLGVPMGYALSAPPLAAMAVFLALGLGLALPYLLLAAAPQLAQSLPRPGPWMTRVKQLFSFAMFGTVVWLAWVVTLQAGPQSVVVLGAAFVIAAMAAWLFGLAQGKAKAPIMRATALIALLVALAPITTLTTVASDTSYAGGAVTKEAYDETRLAALQAEGTPVFIDFTAAWCITCQYNKRVVLNLPEMQEMFAKTGTVFMVADLTNPDPVITAAIERQGRSGVPLYLYYNGAGDPEILPQILTTDVMRDTLEQRS